MRAVVLASVVLGWAAAGCVQTTFTRMTALEVPARPADCHLDVVWERPPPYRYVELGLVTTDTTSPHLFAAGENEIVSMRRVMEQACTAGAHGLMNVTAQTRLVPVGKGTWKEITGSAVAFVYVDASGRPLSPPGP